MPNIIALPKRRRFHPSVPPAPDDPPPVDGYFMAKSGLVTNPGTEAQPFPPNYALAGASGLIAALKTLWVRGGVYRGDWTSALPGGNVDTPVIVRAYPGERAIFDGDFESTGPYDWFWDLEFMVSSPDRFSAQTGSFPTDIPGRFAKTAFVRGPGRYNKWINNLLHDMGEGMGDPEGSIGTEATGNIECYGGWWAPDRLHGHSVYIQNDTIRKLLRHNVFFGAFQLGWQFGGTSGARIKNIDVEDNVIFENGMGDAAGPQGNLSIYGGMDFFPDGLGWLNFLRNHMYGKSVPGIAGPGVELNRTGDRDFPATAIVFEYNYVHGVSNALNPAQSSFVRHNTFTAGTYELGAGGIALFTARLGNGAVFGTNTVDFNAYWLPAWGTNNPFTSVNGSNVSAGYNTLAAWRSATGYDLNSTMTVGQPPNAVVIQPNPYEAGRALIICRNETLDLTMAVDLSQVGGYSNGDRYVIHHVYDPRGAPVASGIYSSGVPIISLGQYGYMPLKAIAYPTTGPTIAPKFNVFLIRKVTDNVVPTAPSGFVAVPGSRYDKIAVSWTRNSTNEKGFQLERLQDSDWIPHEIFPAGAVSGEATDTAGLTSYTLRVRSYGEAGHSDPSNTDDATTISSVGSIIVSDSMTGPAGTLLVNHAGEIGKGYVRHPTRTGTFQITNENRLRQSSGVIAMAIALDVPASVSYDVEVDVTVKSMETGQFYLYLGLDPTLDLGYNLRRQANSGTWEAWRFSSVPASSQLGSSVPQALSVGSTYHMMVRRAGTTLSFWIDDTKIIGDIVDANLTAIGRVGLRSGINAASTFDDAHGYHFSNLTVTNRA